MTQRTEVCEKPQYSKILNSQAKGTETWDETNVILANEIKKKLPDLELDVIKDKIERTHRSKESNYSHVLPIIANFTNWPLTERIKSEFIKVNRGQSQNGNPIIVSQMFSFSYSLKKQSHEKTKRVETGGQQHPEVPKISSCVDGKEVWREEIFHI